jgi:hypothetical protein
MAGDTPRAMLVDARNVSARHAPFRVPDVEALDVESVDAPSITNWASVTDGEYGR